MLNYNELKPGTFFILEGQPYEVLEYNFLRLQQRKPVAQTKIRNLITGKIQERNFHQNETFQEAEIERKKMKYLYSHREKFYFSEISPVGRENEKKSRIELTGNLIADKARFLKQNEFVEIIFFKNEPIGIILPIKMDLKVKEAAPGIKGNTAQGGVKPVILETGVKINVPLFIKEGDIVRVNTQTGEYVQRINN